jgi:trans-aconitate methyltransferase
MDGFLFAVSVLIQAMWNLVDGCKDIFDMGCDTGTSQSILHQRYTGQYSRSL